MQSTGGAEVPAVTLRSTAWNGSTKTLRPWWMPWRPASGEQVDVYGHSHGGIVAFGAASLTAHIHKLVFYEGWPVPDLSIYALPADVVSRMDELLA